MPSHGAICPEWDSSKDLLPASWNWYHEPDKGPDVDPCQPIDNSASLHIGGLLLWTMGMLG